MLVFVGFCLEILVLEMLAISAKLHRQVFLMEHYYLLDFLR